MFPSRVSVFQNKVNEKLLTKFPPSNYIHIHIASIVGLLARCFVFNLSSTSTWAQCTLSSAMSPDRDSVYLCLNSSRDLFQPSAETVLALQLINCSDCPVPATQRYLLTDGTPTLTGNG